MRANVRPMQMDYQNNLIQAQGLSKLGGADAIRGNFGQRLFDLNTKFNASQDDYNNQRLTYNEINQQREMLGLEPISMPESTIWEAPQTKTKTEPVVEKVFSPGPDGKMNGLTEELWNEREQLLRQQ
jgi:hypothetical protein